MAKKLWKIKLAFLLFLLMILGAVIALFPLKVLRWEKMDAREVTLGMHWENLPLIGRFFPPPEIIVPEEQPTWELQVIASQRLELENKQKKAQEEMERLRKVKDDIVNQRRELKKIRDELELMIGTKEEQDAGLSSDKNKELAVRLTQLAKSYEKMDPGAAANAFNAMEDTDVIKIMSRMRGKYVSRVIEAMDPQKAAKISTGMIKGK